MAALPPKYAIINPQAHSAGDDLETPSENKPENRQENKKLTNYFKDGWAMEIISFVFGLLLVVALCVILKTYDGKPVPSFGSVFSKSITLNTIVSILTNLAIPSFVFPVSECISQMKWMWYLRDGSTLMDMDTFDAASRGTIGGLNFLIHIRTRSIASIGACLMILQLVISPLVQNAILYPSFPVSNLNSTDASVLTTTEWFDYGDQIVSSTQISDIYSHNSLGMKGAIQTGLFSLNKTVDFLQPSCSTANCTIGPYKTLGVCASVADISDSLTHKSAKNGTIYSLPGGHSVQQDNTDEVRLYFVSAQTPNEDESGSVATPLNFSSSVAFQNVSAPIADVFIIYLDETVSGDIGNAYHAIEFVLDWCVQTLESTVDAGKISTQRLEEDHSFAIPDNSKNVRSGGYSVYINTHCSLQRYLQQLLEGKASGSVTVTADSDISQAFYTPISVSKVRAGVAPIDGIKAILDNVAMSMTNEVRANDGKSAATLGTSIVLVPTVQIVWGYVSALLVFMVICLLFFIWTVVLQLTSRGSRGDRSQSLILWKSSSLALLRALDHNDDSSGIDEDGGGGLRELSAMQIAAKRSRFQLGVQSNDSWSIKKVPSAALVDSHSV